MLHPADESHVAFVKDRGPLHGRAMQHLAITAMTDLGINRVSANLVAHRIALAASGILLDEALIVGRSVAWSEFH